jgi:hypothetical protein
MAKLSTLAASPLVKLVYIGESGTGKTGSLVSLVAAGYKLKVLDIDNNIDVLSQWVMHDCEDKIDNVDVESLRDDVVAGPNGPIVRPKAYVNAIKLLNKWSDGSVPGQGGPNEVFVLDTLWSFSKAAFEWAKQQAPSAKDPRQWYFAAQQSVESVLGMLTSPNFATNLIIMSHISYKDLSEDTVKGYPTAIGQAMGPTIPKYFNTMIQAELAGSGKNARRTIRTLPTPNIDLKNPSPFKMEERYDLGDGLAKIFQAIKEA